MLLPSALHAQYLAYSFKANAKTGKQLYKSACAACHGNDGKGAPQSLTVFERPSSFPDFTRCDQTTAETNTSYKAMISYGGPNRGFSQIMPAFHEALSSEEIDDIVAYLREFCPSSHWPRGELNVPRAIVTEKAYPEDEVVLSTGINANGTPGNESHIIHEQRFGVRNQIEVDVPILFQDQDHTWYGGVGDVTLGLKRVLFSNLRSGSILSLQGGFLLPTRQPPARISEAAQPPSSPLPPSTRSSAATHSFNCNSARTCLSTPARRHSRGSSTPQSAKASRPSTGWAACGRPCANSWLRATW